jgi:hypothetical protein
MVTVRNLEKINPDLAQSIKTKQKIDFDRKNRNISKG